MINRDDFILIVGAGDRSSREFMLRDICDYYKGSIALVTQNKASWEKQYVDAEIYVESYSNEDVLKAVQAFANQKTVQGILTYNERNIPVTAFVSSKLGLHGSSYKTALCARNKYLMRSAFKRCGAPSAESCLVHTIKEAEEFALANGYPMVLKPVMGSASNGAIKIETRNDLLKYFDHVRQVSKEEYGSDDLLLEEYLDGGEVSIEAIVYNGNVSVIAVTDKFKSAEPFFEEIGHTLPSGLPEPVLADIKAAAIAGIKALGIKNGLTHCEIKTTSKGPKIVEIAARPGGDFIAKLVELSTGVNFSRALVDICTGQKPDTSATKNKVSAVRFIVPEKEGVLLGYSDFEQFNKVDWVKEFEFFGSVGDKILLPPNKYCTRLGHYIVEANNHSEMKNRLETMNEKFSLEIFEGL